MKQSAGILKKHLRGIINAVVLKAYNGAAESVNSRIKMIKVRSWGFRNKGRLRNAVYSYLDGLDRCPTGIK